MADPTHSFFFSSTLLLSSTVGYLVVVVTVQLAVKPDEESKVVTVNVLPLVVAAS